MLSVAIALYHEETVQQTASEEPGFTGTYPGAVFMNQHGVESRLSGTVSASQLLQKNFNPESAFCHAKNARLRSPSP